MSANGEGLGRVLGVALGLCLVCSVVVSTAAVLLKPAQQANKTLDLKRNILMAAGLLDPALSVEEQFEQVETRVVDLDQGRFVDGVDPAAFDQRKAAKDPAQSRAIPGGEDPAKLRRIFTAGYRAGLCGIFCRLTLIKRSRIDTVHKATLVKIYDPGFHLFKLLFDR